MLAEKQFSAHQVVSKKVLSNQPGKRKNSNSVQKVRVVAKNTTPSQSKARVIPQQPVVNLDSQPFPGERSGSNFNKFIFIGLSITALLGAGYYFFNSSDSQKGDSLLPEIDIAEITKAAETDIPAPTPSTTPSNQYDLEGTALDIIHNNNWNEKNIIYFAHGWNALTQKQQAETKQTVWFQLFENEVEQKLSSTSTKSAAKSGLTNKQKKLLSVLAERLQITVETDTPTITAEVKSKRPISNAKRSESPPTSTVKPTKKAQVVTKPKLETPTATIPTPKNETIAVPTSAATLAATPKTAPIETVAQEKPSRLPAAAVIPQQKTVKPTPSVKKEVGPTYAELQQIVKQFTNAYNRGDVKKFTSLFALHAITNEQNNLSQIGEEYESLFKNTMKRQMVIRDLRWTLVDNKAVGKGIVSVSVLSYGESQVRTHKGRIQFVVEKEFGEVLITRLYHLVD